MIAAPVIDMTRFRARVVNVHVHAYDVYCGRAGNGHGDGYFGNYSTIPGDPGDVRVRIARVKDFLVYFRHRMGLIHSERWKGSKILGQPIEFGELEYKRRVNTELRGALGCHCVPALCHVEIYAAWINDGPTGLFRLEQRIAKLEAQV
jgi:hypothetical protein